MTADPAAVPSKVHSAGGQKHQRLRHPAVQGQLDDALLIDQLAERTVSRPDKFGIGLDRHLLTDLADLHDDHLGCRLVDGEVDAGLNVCRKASPFYAQLVTAYWKSGE